MLKEFYDKLISINNETCLNPYFNGTCSKSEYVRYQGKELVDVLILILMEHAQRVSLNITRNQCSHMCLNPYFNGTCSKRHH